MKALQQFNWNLLKKLWKNLKKLKMALLNWRYPVKGGWNMLFFISTLFWPLKKFLNVLLTVLDNHFSRLNSISSFSHLLSSFLFLSTLRLINKILLLFILNCSIYLTKDIYYFLFSRDVINNLDFTLEFADCSPKTLEFFSISDSLQ